MVYATEASMVADYLESVTEHRGWTPYAETAGWDLVLVRDKDGFQIGIEAKLSLNAKVLCQVIDHQYGFGRGEGPDIWAVLVPRDKVQVDLARIARRLSIVILRAGDRIELPDHHWSSEETGLHGWPERCPDSRLRLPDYIPDVQAGKPAPVSLTPWKIGAIKLAILLEVRGFLTNADFRAIHISMSRWTDPYPGWLVSAGRGTGRWLRGALPDFRLQHPVNYEQIKADFEKWAPPAVEIEKPLL